MRADGIGLYVHIPFCVRKCNYCDFCSFKYDTIADPDAYVNALCDEILTYKDRKISADTVFFGGGTPSLLSGVQFGKIFDALRLAFDISPDAEITMEINPGTITRDKAIAYAACGVNRFSIGTQSIHENELKNLGRIHLYDDFLNSYNMLRSIGINNISVDLMYGIPDQTRKSFTETVRTIADLAPEHISVYGLILEEGTNLWRRKDELVLPDEDTECDMYFDAVSILGERGYEHYEISNYAIPGMRSRHNLKYWKNSEYIGVGLSAYSYFDGSRYGNTSNFDAYLGGAWRDSDRRDVIDASTKAYEYVMLALRLSDGFSLAEYRDRFGTDFLSGRESEINKLISLGFAEITDGRFRLTDRGLYVSNSIICSLI